MIFWYDLLLFLLVVPVAFFFLYKSRADVKGHFLFRWKERFGIWGRDTEKGTSANKPVLWIHCASLGEVRAVEPLIRELTEYRILLTTVTVSGHTYASQNKIGNEVFLAPLDFSFLTKRVMSRIKPRALLFVETELWPGLIWGAHKTGVKTAVVNGRISINSFPLYRSVDFVLKRIFRTLGYVCARSAEDAERFISLGASKDRVHVTGNMKYDREFKLPDIDRGKLGFNSEDKILVIGSLRPGEEKIVIGAYKKLTNKFPGLKIVIAPRHMISLPNLEQELSKNGISFVKRSQGGKGSSPCLILDTFGELANYYAISDISFVGGSFVRKGGQNPIEPAAFSKPVIFGPHMENFLSEAAALQKAGGGFMANDVSDLEAVIDEFLSSDKKRLEAGAKAAECVRAQQGAVKKTAEMLRSFL